MRGVAANLFRYSGLFGHENNFKISRYLQHSLGRMGGAFSTAVFCAYRYGAHQPRDGVARYGNGYRGVRIGLLVGEL